MAQAAAEMDTIGARLKLQHGRHQDAVAVTMMTLRDSLTEISRRTLWLLLGAVRLVLLIACANALGADARSVIGLILRSALGSVGVGIAVGALAGVAAVRLPTTFLFEVTPLDPAAFAGAAAVLAAVALAAACVPTRRAPRVDPLQALRAQ